MKKFLGILIVLAACNAGAAEKSAVNLGSYYGHGIDPQAEEQIITLLRQANFNIPCSGVVRLVKHGDMVTMDYNANRLNIRLDENYNVTSLDCG